MDNQKSALLSPYDSWDTNIMFTWTKNIVTVHTYIYILHISLQHITTLLLKWCEQPQKNIPQLRRPRADPLTFLPCPGAGDAILPRWEPAATHSTSRMLDRKISGPGRQGRERMDNLATENQQKWWVTIRMMDLVRSVGRNSWDLGFVISKKQLFFWGGGHDLAGDHVTGFHSGGPVAVTA